MLPFMAKSSRFLRTFFYVRYSTLLHLPPLRFHCVGGCWDWTQDCCDLSFSLNPCFLTNSLARVNNPYFRESVCKTMVARVAKFYKFRTLIIVELWKEEFWNLGQIFLSIYFTVRWCVSNMCQMSFICLIFGDRGCQHLDVFLIGN
jgi:hypothetical protein